MNSKSDQDLQTICEVRKDPESLKSYGKDWSMNFAANPCAIAFPESIEDVKNLVLWARKNKTPLVPSGGRTGLSAGATATNNEVVVSFERMNKISNFNAVDETVTVQAGVITEALHDFVEDKGYFFPVDFAAKGSSQIGGNIATNAGGLRVLRYGSMGSWVSGLTVVTGEGEVLKLNRDLVKNATGYNLKNLFVGSEGTLGFIVEAQIKVTRPPAHTTVLVLGLESLDFAPEVYRSFRHRLTLSACEFFSDRALEKVLQMHPLSPPFETPTPYFLLLEVEHQTLDISESLMSVFEHCVAEGWVSDGIISQSPSQAEDLWKLREFISESISPESPYKNDVSVRISDVARFSKDLQETFRSDYQDFEIILFGHIGDGNVHVNILKPPTLEKEDFLKKCHKAEQSLFAIVQKYEGAVSAEHGVGLVKKKALHYSRTSAELQLMKQIKKAFDPDGILNPGKIFDPQQ